MDINKQKFKDEFLVLKPLLEKLGYNTKHALETFLNKQEISFLSIDYRVKETDSYLGKIERKEYLNPIDDIEDLCGLRIICYNQSDIDKIENIIKNEFQVKEYQNKQDAIEITQFGYRSNHFIAKIKEEWLLAPNFRELGGLKFEIQLRTILMHAWAEIVHKLSYKSKSQIPKELQRKFSRISAKLEEADEQFDELKDEIVQMKLALLKNAKRYSKFDLNLELNLVTLQAFLDYAFPNREKNENHTADLLNDMIKNSISFKDLMKGFEDNKDLLPRIEKSLIKLFNSSEDKFMWAQVGAARVIMMVINQEYLDKGKGSPHVELIRIMRN